jgi:16S rRNA (cytidine1402-2'-O)-methyltransferase
MKENALLFFIPTPIGNLEDITIRAIRILKQVDLILAEDTRNTRVLLDYYQIKNRIRSYHAYNEHKITDKIIQELKKGTRIGLVTDSGTPGISDPGYLLVKECIRNNIPFEILPGATSLIPALIKSGFPNDRFAFEGFLPHKKGRKTRLNKLRNETRTMIFFESPHRLIKCLKEFREIFNPARRVSVSRELSKKFEETIYGTIEELIDHFEHKTVKGEIVIVVEGID